MDIAWWEPRVGDTERELVNETLASNYLNDGSTTRKFESEICRFLNVEHAVGVTSGTTAVFLALKALGIGAGDEVIVPDLTFIATANAVTMTGAKPILVDIDPESLTLSVAAVKKAITPKTKAIVPVHLSGRAGTIREILTIAKENKLFVVEDAAQAFGSRIGGKSLGTLGHVGCFSFSPNKTITTGQGGAVVTNDINLMHKLRSLKDQGRPVQGTGGDDIHLSVGFNFKLSNMQAAVGLGQMGRITERIARMKLINQIYQERLSHLKGFKLYKFNLEGGEVPQWSDAFVEDRDGLEAYLREKKISTRKFYFPVHSQQAYKMDDSGFPNAVKASAHSLWIPSWFELTEKQVHQVCDEIEKFYK